MSEKKRCIIVDDEPIAIDILVRHLSRIDSVKVVATCKSAMEAFSILNNNEIDLIFLDINMPEISGLSFAKNISKNIKVIFTTAYRDYAVEGFDLQAIDYLLKPISYERLLQGVMKIISVTENKIQPSPKDVIAEIDDFIFVRSDRKMIKINFNDINYIESLSDYLKIYLQGKVIITRETISSIEAKLPKDNFIRIHRSYIISLPKIDSFTNEFVEIVNRALPISRTYKKEVHKRLNKRN